MVDIWNIANSRESDGGGQFTEKDHGRSFVYVLSPKHYSFPKEWQAEYPHMIEVRQGLNYAGIVKKTVVYIVVDEAADGSPVTEKWHIKQHGTWSK